MSSGQTDLSVPRRSSPRTRIPAGAVGLAGEFTGIYPQASPGGWQLIGVTDLPMWDLARAQPALLQPGFSVRFVDVTGRRKAAMAKIPSAPDTLPAVVPSSAALEVVQAGLQALFQDAGRAHQAHLGVGRSGALDQTAWRTANRLVGNPPGTAGIEVAGGGFRVRAVGDVVVAVTGADIPLTLHTVDGARLTPQSHSALALMDGDELAFGEPRAGSRAYLAARGGFAVRPVLDSCATDSLARLGPPPLAAGDRWAILPVAVGAIVGAAEAAPGDLPRAGETVTLDVVMGPRTDWFTPEAQALLAHTPWQVTPQSSRVGLRLSGTTALQRTADTLQAELPSEGTVRGAIQVPPNGQPVLFLADHPLTGGYPVIAAVAPYHLDRAGQIPVGAWVRFNPVQTFATL